MATPNTSAAGDEFVVVKSGTNTPPSEEKATSKSTEEVVKGEDHKCPEILYKVQYKDLSGTLKGTKILSEPYKLKKTVYRDGEIPILEVLYTVTVWFPTLNKPIKRRNDDTEEENLLDASGESTERNFDERSMEEKELVSAPVKLWVISLMLT